MNKNKNLMLTFNSAIKKLKNEGYDLDIKKDDTDDTRIMIRIRAEDSVFTYVGVYSEDDEKLFTIFIYAVEFDDLPIKEGSSLSEIVNAFNKTNIGTKCIITSASENKIRFQNDHFYKKNSSDSDIVEDIRYFIYDAKTNVSYLKSIIDGVEFKK